ncbi:MAG TPA: ATP-binding cassette domain-containing protein [Candidatus Polarisedimenticolaceae bacterium]|nr:ATP-binding cassette domain-containing protein [Candidatus Polarisedimenticolaceae bacterium]
MIEIRDLWKNYGETQALRGVGFSIRRGEVVGLLGPNGAGKTTTMKIVVGYLTPSRGTATVAGIDVGRDPLGVQRLIGYLPENAPLYSDMLAQEYLEFMADVRQLAAVERRARIEQVVDECAIQSVLTRPIGHLSKGFRQRVGLASTLLHDPPILILDEPTGGLDPNQIVEVRELIRRLGRTKTIILSTHILSEVEMSCGRAVIVIDGRVRADGSLDELTRAKAQLVTVKTGDPSRAAQLFEAVPQVERVEVERGADGFDTFRLGLAADVEVGESVAEIARRHDWPIRELRRDDKSLEQVFRELTETDEEAAA